MTETHVAVITGGARGIGYATCLTFAESGYAVALIDRDREALEGATARLREAGTHIEAYEADVSSFESVKRTFVEIGEVFDHVDALVNNAGSIGPGAAETLDDKTWTNLLDVHLTGTFACCREAFGLLRKSQAPAIVNVSSVGAAVGLSRRGSYCAAKGGIEGFTRSLAVEWGAFGIRVNAVAPGHIFTDMTQDALEAGLLSQERLDARVKRIPLARLGDAGEIGDVIVFLASPGARYVTGAVLTVDGGYIVNGDEI